MAPILLASASPQRKRLLEGLGVPFTVSASSVDESESALSDPRERASELARRKAEDIAAKNQGSVVIGCDTIVVAPDGTLLEKPSSAEEARGMLRKQSGGTSVVHSALAVIDASGRAHEGMSSSKVTFKKLSDEDAEWWIRTGLWKERSGGFQIDGQGQLMIERIDGDWTSVVGLPVFLLGELMKKAGCPLT